MPLVVQCPCCLKHVERSKLMSVHLPTHNEDAELTFTFAGERVPCSKHQDGFECPFSSEAECSEIPSSPCEVFEHLTDCHADIIQEIFYTNGQTHRFRDDGLSVVQISPKLERSYRPHSSHTAPTLARERSDVLRARSASPSPRRTNTAGDLLSRLPRPPSPPKPSPLIDNDVTMTSEPQARSEVAPSVPPSPTVYDPALDHVDGHCYGTIDYRDLVASSSALAIAISRDFVKLHGGYSTVFNFIAVWMYKNRASCPYHALLPSSHNENHRTLLNCSGPIGGLENHYYSVYRKVLRSRKGHCYHCWRPTSVQAFNHPRKGCTNDRDLYEDKFRGIPYLVWRVEALRRLVFDFLGLSDNLHSFSSTVDYCRWLTSLYNSGANTSMTNMHLVIYAFASLQDNQQIPKEEYELDGKSFIIYFIRVLTLCL
ncbi:hypothetical protein VKT23_009678 [Stygiomarasmius scandens]|uniref:C2H2-type domain-containing protein n=1 Tax=Marasmiellus scandens TaxID=2682957 RepID=A0ABR1JE15_9AGAR